MMKQYALVFDLRRCIGCLTCVTACKVENDLDAGYSWMKVLTKSNGHYPDLTIYWEPVTCMQCRQPPCMDACPRQAIYKRNDGVVIIDKSQCDGCRNCLAACPYDVIQFNAGEEVADKCTLCVHRIDKGLLPFCAKECVWGAIHFGDISDPRSEISQLIDSRKGYIMRPEEGTTPSICYLSP